MIKGAAALALVGTAAYLYSSSSPRTQRKIKKATGDAIHSAGNALDNVAKII